MALSRKPVKGDIVRWPDSWPVPGIQGVVVSTPEPGSNLCFIDIPGESIGPFLWRSRNSDGVYELNARAEIVEVGK